MRPVKLLLVSSSLALLASTLGGCAENRTTMYILGVQGFPADGECEVGGGFDSDQVGVAHGYFDPQAGSAYFAPIVIGNQLVPQGDNDTLRPETSRIQLEGAEIHMLYPDGETEVTFDGQQGLTVPFAGTIDPVNSSNPGLATVMIPLLPAASSGVSYEDGVYTVTIEVFGTTLGNTEVESGPFSFPVTVENGYAYSSCIPSSAAPAHPCGWFQDGYIFPCADYADYSFCSDACQ